MSRSSWSNYLRWTARILALAVASFWLWWGVGSTYVEGSSLVSLPNIDTPLSTW